QNDLKPHIGWEWIQGKASIRDRRCLWVNLSTPLVLDSQPAYSSLETAWREIYPWLSQNFPSL
ncbi:MAG: cyanoexosortase A system-associated protein, partial [Pleurocapsa sp.]